MRRRAAFGTLWRVFRQSRRPGSPGIGELLKAVPRMVLARLRGEYPDLSFSRLLLLVGAAVYIVSPLDFLPEALLLVFGLADDVIVAGWLAGALFEEAERFLAWEKGRRHSVVDGATAR